jgi:Tfp pilus assembly protein PilV
VNPRSRPAEGGSVDGFTIVEVLVAITVLVIAMIGAALLFENAIITSGNTRNRVVAANLATEQMESVRGQASNPATFQLIPQGTTTYPTDATDPTNAQLVNGIQYTVEQAVQFVGQNSTTSSCDSPGPTNGQILQVSETVTWNDMGGTQPIHEVTALAPPVGVYSTSTGSIAVKILDSTGAPSDSVNVQISGPTTLSQATTGSGCAYFAFVPAGTYAVSVVDGGVGDQEVSPPVQNASVSIGQTAPVQFQYDTAATIVATIPASPPPATGMSISVANTGLQPYGQFSFAATGATTTSPPLFPYVSGYTVFAGNCTDNNPLGKDTSRNPYYPTAAPLPLAVTPGGSSAATVPLYAVSVHVQNATGGAAVAGATMTAKETSFPAPYVAVCTSGTATGSAPTLGLSTSSATGDSVTALPLGHWAIKATSGARNLTVNVWVKPDGVYAVDGTTGASTTKYPGAITMALP